MAIGKSDPPLAPEKQLDEQPLGDRAEGDFRGKYGYGRPAHKPDPAATYVFRPESSRVLPVKAGSRWR